MPCAPLLALVQIRAYLINSRGLLKHLKAFNPSGLLESNSALSGRCAGHPKTAVSIYEIRSSLAVRTTNAAHVPGTEPADLLNHHAAGFWSDVCEEDWKGNEEALRQGWRLLSSYDVAESEKVWVITEAGRSATTILRPKEY